MVLQRPTRIPGLVMGPCIVEIDRIVIREVHYQLEVNWCRIEEIIVKGNFGWAWPMCAVEIDRIVIREVQYQFEVNRCRNEEIIVPYQFEVNRCRNEEIIVKGIFGWAWPMWVGFPRVDSFVIRKVQYQFEWEWPMWAGPPGLVMGPCIVEIYRIVIREVWYQFEDNQCRNEEIIFQGSSAYSVGGDSGQARTDGRRRYPQYDQNPHAFQKVQSNITGILPRPTMTNRALIYTLKRERARSLYMVQIG
ncbi:hypothetical protein DPMN_034860 [Dreissena polymorpha]|uniref:Uncharacterized protein n=1 Tax=Dreissena polymorpha TaxID=45954 RepID=A0A9D4RK34_DREPO|nr:hypothetical protein DPMN_034860 [Dreissena polymorpha]